MRPLSRYLGLTEYSAAVSRMRAFTDARTDQTRDEFWFVEHPPVFTQGQAGKAEHVLAPGNIPVVQSNRGGQVTYHGPGQLVMYPLIDLHRRNMGIRQLVSLLETAMVETLNKFSISGFPKPDAPGVYVEAKFSGGREIRKIGSIGLRVSRGCSYHGISLNVDMDLEPFARINPCGFSGLSMTQIADLGQAADLGRASARLRRALEKGLEAYPVQPVSPRG